MSGSAGPSGLDVSSWKRICTTVNTLREGLDPGGWMLAVQDFHHATLKGEEAVADIIR